jgi:hypothetical protein
MGRTIPSFRIALEMEKEEWKPFRNALDKSDRKKFDKMFDIPKLHISLLQRCPAYKAASTTLLSICSSLLQRANRICIRSRTDGGDIYKSHNGRL